MIQCPKCNNDFDPGKWKKRFCSRKCANSRIFSDLTNKRKSEANKKAYLTLTPEKKQNAIEKRLNTRKQNNPDNFRFCLDCQKPISKQNKHLRCQVCYYKSDACSHALGHYRNYKRLSVIDSLGQSVFLMSSLEIEFYNYLTMNNIQWKKANSISYIDNTGKVHWYKPDFHIIDSNEIIEIKGYFWNNDKIKMKWVIEQNPNLTIKIYTKKELKTIGGKSMGTDTTL